MNNSNKDNINEKPYVISNDLIKLENENFKWVNLRKIKYKNATKPSSLSTPVGTSSRKAAVREKGCHQKIIIISAGTYHLVISSQSNFKPSSGGKFWLVHHNSRSFRRLANAISTETIGDHIEIYPRHSFLWFVRLVRSCNSNRCKIAYTMMKAF